MYNLEKPYYISNSRDKNGYRSSQDYSNKNIILTIGGSTTTQRFLDEKHTFQNVLSRKLDHKFAVLNGGVSGQSSFGHLFSIKNWHSKTLAVEKIKYIVYFFGINDKNLLNKVPNFEDYEADAYANKALASARGESAQLLQEAEAYRAKVINEATGQASRFESIYQEYVKSKDVTRKRLYLDTMEKMLGKVDKVILDNNANGEQGVVPYLPLPELKKKVSN